MKTILSGVYEVTEMKSYDMNDHIITLKDLLTNEDNIKIKVNTPHISADDMAKCVKITINNTKKQTPVYIHFGTSYKTATTYEAI